MPFKARTESLELKILRLLNTRMELAPDKQKQYVSLEKGFEGEVQFDRLTEKLESDCLILNDLLFEVNNSTFQIDTLIIFQDIIYLIDIKNFEGDYCYHLDSFHTVSGKEFKNPLDQLKRCHFLFRQLIQSLGNTLSIEATVVFVNPEFTLYLAPKNLPFILPTQLNRFLKKLNSKPSTLNNKHIKLADKLVSLHINEFPFSRLHCYEYDQLKKGITCKLCNSFSLALSVRGKEVVCNECGHHELVDSAVLRSVEEYSLLFPNRKITTKDIFEWCQMVESKKRIQRILGRNLKIISNQRWAYYE